jgi:hypothetical protein
MTDLAVPFLWVSIFILGGSVILLAAVVDSLGRKIRESEAKHKQLDDRVLDLERWPWNAGGRWSTC